MLKSIHGEHNIFIASLIFTLYVYIMLASANVTLLCTPATQWMRVFFSCSKFFLVVSATSRRSSISMGTKSGYCSQSFAFGLWKSFATFIVKYSCPCSSPYIPSLCQINFLVSERRKPVIQATSIILDL